MPWKSLAITERTVWTSWVLFTIQASNLMPAIMMEQRCDRHIYHPAHEGGGRGNCKPALLDSANSTIFAESQKVKMKVRRAAAGRKPNLLFLISSSSSKVVDSRRSCLCDNKSGYRVRILGSGEGGIPNFEVLGLLVSFEMWSY